jgi:hypothetical protein
MSSEVSTMPDDQTTNAVTAVRVTSEVISKPGATLEVKVVTIPLAVKEGITVALQAGKKMAKATTAK